MAGGSSETTRHLKASPKEEGCPLVTAGGGCFRNEPQASSSGPAQTAPLSASESPGQGPRGRGLDTRHRSAPLPKLCEVHLQARICRLFPWAPLLHRQGLHLSGCRTDTTTNAVSEAPPGAWPPHPRPARPARSADSPRSPAGSRAYQVTRAKGLSEWRVKAGGGYSGLPGAVSAEPKVPRRALRPGK